MSPTNEPENEHKEHPMMTSLLLDRVDADETELDVRGFDEIDADEADFAVVARETLFGLPARPGTIR